MFGYAGKLLFVDLSDKTYTIETLSEEDARNFVGGPSLGAKVLFDRMPAHTPPFAKESMIGFVAGPMNGCAALMGGRYTVVSKSPVTGGWNDANSGGNFGPQLKRAGFDGVFVSGISDEPVYIFIDSGNVEIRPAGHLWGLTTVATENALRKENEGKKIGAALIGPAGEQMSYIACVMNDSHRAAGRGGSGAVMGSKKLKALVVSGNLPIEVADRPALLELNKETTKWDKEGPIAPIFSFTSQFGTGGSYESCIEIGDASVKNWLGSALDMTDEQKHAVSAQAMDELFKKKKFACNACPLGCGAIYDVLESKYDLHDTGRPEYETSGMFGSMLLNDDPISVNECNFLCNEYGFDTISAGGTIAWLMEAYNNGIFSQEELDGIDLKWGNSEAIVAIMEKLCANEGIGHLLFNGSREAARTAGKGFECLVEAGGIELPQHDSRFSTGLARTYKYDPTPGRHVKGGLGPGYGNQPPEIKFDYSNTGERDLAGVINQEILNAAGFCQFSDFGLPPKQKLKYLNAVCGFGYSEEEGETLGKRLFAMRQAFNLREGFRRADATLAPRMEGRPPLTEGPLAGVTVDTEQMADNFYKALDWDVKTAMIPKEILEEYGGMESVIKALYPSEI